MPITALLSLAGTHAIQIAHETLLRIEPGGTARLGLGRRLPLGLFPFPGGRFRSHLASGVPWACNVGLREWFEKHPFQGVDEATGIRVPDR